jgi:plasmid stabilization system protein ParE
MATIAWTQEAQRWLEDIFEYIALDNPQAAARTVQEIYERARRFSPVIPKLDTATLLLGGTSESCSMGITGSLASKDDGNIDVLGIFHGALDITKYKLWMAHNRPIHSDTKLPRSRVHSSHAA